MSRIYYSPTAEGFFHEAHHGPRSVIGADPKWKRPRGKRHAGDEPPLVELPNPASKIPGDAVEISEAEYAALLGAHRAGRQIGAGPDGRPVAIAPAPPPPERLWIALRDRRNALLGASDWSQLADVPAALQAAWRPYRQALRDLPAKTRDPRKPSWPEPPQ